MTLICFEFEANRNVSVRFARQGRAREKAWKADI
jgi:hypothetical protein